MSSDDRGRSKREYALVHLDICVGSRESIVHEIEEFALHTEIQHTIENHFEE